MRQRDRRSAAKIDLDLLGEQIAALRELAEDPDEDRVYDFSIRWGALVAGRLQRLDYYYRRAEELTAAERKQYEMLVGELRDVAPLLDRLHLAQPKIASDGAAFE